MATNTETDVLNAIASVPFITEELLGDFIFGLDIPATVAKLVEQGLVTRNKFGAIALSNRPPRKENNMTEVVITNDVGVQDIVLTATMEAKEATELFEKAGGRIFMMTDISWDDGTATVRFVPSRGCAEVKRG